MGFKEDVRSAKSSLVTIFREEGKRYKVGILQKDFEQYATGIAVLYREEIEGKLVIKKPTREDSRLIFKTISENALQDYMAKLD